MKGSKKGILERISISHEQEQFVSVFGGSFPLKS